MTTPPNEPDWSPAPAWLYAVIIGCFVAILTLAFYALTGRLV